MPSRRFPGDPVLHGSLFLPRDQSPTGFDSLWCVETEVTCRFRWAGVWANTHVKSIMYFVRATGTKCTFLIYLRNVTCFLIARKWRYTLSPLKWQRFRSDAAVVALEELLLCSCAFLLALVCVETSTRMHAMYMVHIIFYVLVVVINICTLLPK